MAQLLDILADDAAGHYAEADAAFKALRAAQAAHPRLQAERARQPARDADYGPFTFSPMDPRFAPDDQVEAMFDQITEAKALLDQAFDALGGCTLNADVKAARKLFREAIDCLSDAE